MVIVSISVVAKQGNSLIIALVLKLIHRKNVIQGVMGVMKIRIVAIHKILLYKKFFNFFKFVY